MEEAAIFDNMLLFLSWIVIENTSQSTHSNEKHINGIVWMRNDECGEAIAPQKRGNINL